MLASGLGQSERKRFHFTSEETEMSLHCQREGRPNLLLQVLNGEEPESRRVGSCTSSLFVEFWVAQVPVREREAHVNVAQVSWCGLGTARGCGCSIVLLNLVFLVFSKEAEGSVFMGHSA